MFNTYTTQIYLAFVYYIVSRHLIIILHKLYKAMRDISIGSQQYTYIVYDMILTTVASITALIT